MRKVNWAQIGKVTEPGRYMFRFGYVIVSAEDLAIWQKHPEATFTLLPMFSAGPQEEYKLGAFDVSGGG
ncbi:MAG: hypothetical protein AB7I42_08970 [Bradyrhizobium sp.]|uniref:hypothetical protein n=1 Tax=Bradyrhizobium sp. TaxID=376 RepID=UPI002A33C83B|nr:hypothetical protein [Bradyrhizobium sp.]